MHIILGILGVAGGAIYLIWRLSLYYQRGKVVVNTAKDVTAAARGVKGAVRRGRWKNAAQEIAPLERIETPLAAATAVIVLILRTKRELSKEVREKLCQEMQSVLRLSENEALTEIAEAVYAAQQTYDERRWIRRLTLQNLHACTLQEREDVVTVATAVMEAVDWAGDAERDLLRYYEECALLK